MIGLNLRQFQKLLWEKRETKVLMVLVGSNFLVAGLTLITNVKIANILGKNLFGDIGYAYAIGVSCATLIMFGFDRTLVRDLIHSAGRFEEVFSASLILRGICLLVILLGTIALKLLPWVGFNLSWGTIVIILSISMLALEIRSVYDVWNQINRHSCFYLAYRSLYFIVIWLIILTMPTKLSINIIAFVLLISSILGLFIQYRWVYSRMPLRHEEHLPKWSIQDRINLLI